MENEEKKASELVSNHKNEVTLISVLVSIYDEINRAKDIFK